MPEIRPRMPSGGAFASFLVIVLVALALVAAVVAITTAGVFRTLRPAWALQLAPWDARANAALGLHALARRPTREAAREADRRAADAFRRDPLALQAFSAAGLAAAIRRDQARADRIFGHAARLSRRDPETQLWLIERDVRANDIDGALSHYNVVLRISPGIWPTLFPILSDAAANPPIARALNRLLRSDPIWAHDFLLKMSDRTRSAAALFTVSRGLLRPEPERQREVMVYLLERLVALGRPDLAWTAFETALGPASRTNLLVRDGDFREARGMPPFDWQYAQDGQFMPERRPRPGAPNAYALFLPASPPVDGLAARQLLRLPAGAYQLGAVVGEVTADPARRPYLKIDCVGADGRALARIDFPQGNARLSARFAVPGGCAHQWLAIWVRGDIDTTLPNWPWIGAITIRRR